MLHCKTQTQAPLVLDTIIKGLAQIGLELNLDKTRIVYCKDSNRNVSHEHDQPVHGRVLRWDERRYRPTHDDSLGGGRRTAPRRLAAGRPGRLGVLDRRSSGAGGG
jgi:hypothetical protein